MLSRRTVVTPMVQQVLRRGAGVLVGLLLLLSGGGPTAQAQLRDSARSPRVNDSQAPSRLNPYRPLREDVRQAHTLTVRPTLRPSRSGDSPQLSQGQKLLWGSVGLVVNAVCESRRDPCEVGCEHCGRIGDRAARSLPEGTIGADP